MDDLFQQSTVKARANLYGEIPQHHYGEVTSDSECVHSGQYGLRIVNTKPHSWGGYWGIGFADKPFNTSEFTALNFWVKGKSGGEDITIWVSQVYGADVTPASNLHVEISASEWRLAHVLLRDFADPPDFLTKSVATIYFSLVTEEEAQSICVDDIAFVQ
jgi:hypothetical protein